jgi:hypothetical protein
MIPLNTLALAYITMGIPLLLSSVLFLLSVGSRAGSRIAGSRKAWGLEHGAGGWENGDRRTENGDRRRENGDRRRENGDRRTEKEF